MPLNSYEINNFIESLYNAETWNDSEMGQSVESIFRRTLNAPLRQIYRGQICLAYHITLRKMLDSEFNECLIFLVQFKNDIDSQSLNELLEQMHTTVGKEGLTAQPHFVFLIGGRNDEKAALEDEIKGNIIYDEIGFRDWLKKAHPINEILNTLKNHSIEMKKCPFSQFGPCSPDMFVGRKSLIESIFIDPNIGYAIAGGRRIGKTSLLFELKREVMECKKAYVASKKYRAIYVDCSTFANFQELTDEIAKILFPEYYYKKMSSKDRYVFTFSFKNILERAKSLRGETLLLLLDEMDPLIQRDTNEADVKTFFESLRAEGNKGMLKLVIAGFRHVSKMTRNSDHPFYNICETTHLGGLEKEEVDDLISRPFFRIGVKLESSEDIISRIHDFRPFKC